MMLLYCDTRFARVVCEAGIRDGLATVVTEAAQERLAGAQSRYQPSAPMVAEAASLVVVIVILPVVSSTEACRLLAAKAAIELGQRVDFGRAGTERDARCRAAACRCDGQDVALAQAVSAEQVG